MSTIHCQTPDPRKLPAAFNLYDVVQGSQGQTEKPRDALNEEATAYLDWLARRDGVMIPNGARYDMKGIFHNGRYLVEMPGYGQSQTVICELLDDAGEVSHRMPLPVDGRGKLPMNAKQVIEWTGLAPVRKTRRKQPVQRVEPVEAETVEAVAVDAPTPVPAPNAVDVAALVATVAALAARVGELEAAAVAPVSASRAPLPAPANDTTSRRVRSEREAVAIRRAWAMRRAMRERADLDRRALFAANGAYRGALDAMAHRTDELTTARAECASLRDDLARVVAAAKADRSELARLRPVAAAIAAMVAAAPAAPVTPATVDDPFTAFGGQSLAPICPVVA